MEAERSTSSRALHWSELRKDGLTPRTVLARWGAADCSEPCFKAILRAVSAAGLGQLPRCRGQEESLGEPRAERRPKHWILEGREVLEVAASDPFLSELLARWAREDVATWLGEGQVAVGPHLITVFRPDGTREPRVTSL